MGALIQFGLLESQVFLGSCRSEYGAQWREWHSPYVYGLYMVLWSFLEFQGKAGHGENYVVSIELQRMSWGKGSSWWWVAVVQLIGVSLSCLLVGGDCQRVVEF